MNSRIQAVTLTVYWFLRNFNAIGVKTVKQLGAQYVRTRWKTFFRLIFFVECEIGRRCNAFDKNWIRQFSTTFKNCWFKISAAATFFDFQQRWLQTLIWGSPKKSQHKLLSQNDRDAINPNGYQSNGCLMVNSWFHTQTINLQYLLTIIR